MVLTGVSDAGTQLRFPVRRHHLRLTYQVLLCHRSIHQHRVGHDPRWSLRATDLIAVMEGIIAETGVDPAYVRCDDGPEFTGGSSTRVHPGRTGSLSPSMLSSEGSSSGEIIDAMAEAEYRLRNGKRSIIMNVLTDP